jgi:hypothetical protein
MLVEHREGLPHSRAQYFDTRILEDAIVVAGLRG